MVPIEVDFSELQRAALQMGAEPVKFSVGIQSAPIRPIDVWLKTGIVLDDLSEVDAANGLLNYKGRQILLYIQDQGRSIQQVLQDGSTGRRFHLSDCKTLKEMRDKGRFERYVVTQNMDGEFPVSGKDPITNEQIEGTANLWVCQYCLSQLNYKGATKGNRREIAKNFDICEFFSMYSSFFSHLPRRNAGTPEEEGYTQDWSLVAARYKTSKNFKCESCGVDLSEERQLLHVHHKNGVKSDNFHANLRALCACCHRKQPQHDHMFVRHADTQTITRLCRKQGLLQPTGWASTRKYCDPGLHGFVDALEPECKQAPEVGLDVQDQSRAIVAYLELAWPNTRVGVAISDKDCEAARKAGWRVWTMNEALQHVQEFAIQACGRRRPA